MSSYSRLMAVIDPSNYDDSADNDAATSALNALEECATKAQAILDSMKNSDNPAIGGPLEVAVSAWVNDYIRRIREHKTDLETARSHYTTARAAMKTAAVQAQALPTDSAINEYCNTITGNDTGNTSTTSGTNTTSNTSGDGGFSTVVVAGLIVGAAAYECGLILQQTAERERLAKEYLDTMNSTMTTEATNLLTPPSGDSPWGSPDTGYGAAYTGGSRSPGGLGGPGGAGGTVPAPDLAGSVTSPPPALGGAILSNRPPEASMRDWVFPAPGEPGSRSNPITDPEQLKGLDLLHTPVNQRMTSDGPVGGHLPPPVDNAFDPAWRTGFLGQALGGRTGAGDLAMAGGVIGAGAVAAVARSGMSGLAGLSATGAGGLFSRVPGGGILSPSSTAAARGGTTGMVPPLMGGAPASTDSGKTAGSKGKGAAGHTGQDTKKDDKKRQRKRKGHILRPQDAAPEMVDGQAQGAGSLNDLQPIETQEDDRW